MTTIWVDADACPAVIKDILFRAAVRARITAVFVANHAVRVPASPWLHARQVPRGFDVADEHIANDVVAGDLVVTADVPLAAAVVEKGALALTPRGELYTRNNVGEALALRNFMADLRGSGVQTGGPPSLDQADRHQFARELDRWIASAARLGPEPGTP